MRIIPRTNTIQWWITRIEYKKAANNLVPTHEQGLLLITTHLDLNVSETVEVFTVAIGTDAEGIPVAKGHLSANLIGKGRRG